MDLSQNHLIVIGGGGGGGGGKTRMRVKPITIQLIH